MKLYTAAVVAQWLDISDRRVRQLRQKGVLAEARPGLYNLKDCVHRYIEYLKKDGSPEEAVDYNTERAKLARAKREKEELELDLKRREVIQAADVEKSHGGNASAIPPEDPQHSGKAKSGAGGRNGSNGNIPGAETGNG